jgi:hypothetical protein
MKLENIQRRINGIKSALTALGPMHPGSLSRQYNVCGTAGCRCKDPKHSRKHGPYHQLSYTWRGKSSSIFVRRERVKTVCGQVENYKRLRELIKEWVDLEMERERLERFRGKRSDGD